MPVVSTTADTQLMNQLPPRLPLLDGGANFFMLCLPSVVQFSRPAPLLGRGSFQTVRTLRIFDLASAFDFGVIDSRRYARTHPPIHQIKVGARAIVDDSGLRKIHFWVLTPTPERHDVHADIGGDLPIGGPTLIFFDFRHAENSCV